MDKTVRDVLERAFPVELVKTRKGSFGKTLAYVEVVNYVRRLNEAFGGDWSFDVIAHQVLESEVVVLGKLTAAGISKVAFGGSSITRNRETGEAVSLADDLKAAASDALKKGSSLFGLGLHFYGDDTTATSERPAEIPRSSAAASSGRTPGEDPVKLTERQHRAIVGLADRAGIAEIDLAGWVQRTYGVSVEDLDRRAASELITKLNQSLAGGNGGNGKAAGGLA